MIELDREIDVGLLRIFAARGGAKQRQALDAKLAELSLCSLNLATITFFSMRAI
jgi:hypothetical protein